MKKLPIPSDPTILNLNKAYRSLQTQFIALENNGYLPDERRMQYSNALSSISNAIDLYLAIWEIK